MCFVVRASDVVVSVFDIAWDMAGNISVISVISGGLTAYEPRGGFLSVWPAVDKSARHNTPAKMPQLLSE